MLREAAQQALEALQNCANGEDDVLLTRDALAALRAALVEPAQEPVAWDGTCVHGYCSSPTGCENDGECRGGAASPQRKPLTEQEIWHTYKNLWMFHPAEEPRLAGDVLKFARAIERAHGIV